MNLKVANLIAIQLGIFVGIMSWLAYSRLESAEPRLAAELPQRAVKPVAPAGPGIKADEPLPDAVDYRADRDESQPIAEQPAPTMHTVLSGSSAALFGSGGAAGPSANRAAALRQLRSSERSRRRAGAILRGGESSASGRSGLPGATDGRLRSATPGHRLPSAAVRRIFQFAPFCESMPAGVSSYRRARRRRIDVRTGQGRT